MLFLSIISLSNPNEACLDYIKDALTVSLPYSMSKYVVQEYFEFWYIRVVIMDIYMYVPYLLIYYYILAGVYNYQYIKVKMN